MQLKIRFQLVVLLFLMVTGSFEVSAQLGNRAIRKNNRQISTYRGSRKSFEKEKQYTTIGISLNAANYFGDLAPGSSFLSTDISFTRPGVGLAVGKRLGPRYTLQAQYTYATLQGADAQSADPRDPKHQPRYLRNLSFRNRIQEFSCTAYFDLIENTQTAFYRAYATPYIFAGLAIFRHNPQAKASESGLQGESLPEAGRWVSLRPLGTEGQYAELDPSDVNYGVKPYHLLQISIPLGIGMRLRLTDNVDVSGEIGYRYTFTDYLDDVSRNYVDLGSLASPLAKAMSYRTSELGELSNTVSYQARDGQNYNVQPGYGHEHPSNMRGDSTNKDIYILTTIRLTYILDQKFRR